MKKTGIMLSLFFVFLSSSINLWAVVVGSVQELEEAINNANNGGPKQIVLKKGTYMLSNMLWISANGVTIRSKSGKRDKVILRGRGMQGSVSHIFNVAGTRFTAKDMTIGWVANHAIQIHGNNNSSDCLIQNLHIVDTYEQMIKVSYDSSTNNCSKKGTVKGCLFEYSTGIGPQYYIGGIDAHRAKNWKVQNNIFKNIISPSGETAEYAIHFWSDSENTLVERNWIIDCDRGVGFGLGDRGHRKGTIRNNIVVNTRTDTKFPDVGIALENASKAKVYNNTIYFAHDYPNAIEYRFAGTKGGYIKNNLTNRLIRQRDGGTAKLKKNVTNAIQDWFVKPSTGDLHLKNSIPQVVDKGVKIKGLKEDFDGDTRPQGKAIDIGADEYVKEKET